MRCLISFALLTALIGCGQNVQDLQALKDEIKALETMVQANEEKAEYHFKRLGEGFDREKYLEVRRNLTGEPTEDQITQASKDYHEMHKTEAAAWHFKAIESRKRLDAKRALLKQLGG